MKVKRKERGWPGHFILCHRCVFRRNTLLTCGDVDIVVSTVGLLQHDNSKTGFDTIGFDRHFETMAFHAKADDQRYKDADVTRQINFSSDWAIKELDADDKANEMHEQVVAELSAKLKAGDKFNTN